MNLINVTTVTVLAFMVDKMTNTPKESFIEPISNKKVPFIVYLASIKLLND